MERTNTSTIYLLSCVSKKRKRACAARDCYCSDLFTKARTFIEQTGSSWYILSAQYGLLDPSDVIEPYEKTLKNMSVHERKAWAERVLNQLGPKLVGIDKVVMLAGKRYREFLVEGIWAAGPSIQVPMVRLGIGQQLGWLKRQMRPKRGRANDLNRFYNALGELERILGGKRLLSDCNSRQNCPDRGIYFFFEKGEVRRDSGEGLRVVRVGTHALKTGSKATLWNRLSQHKGSVSSGGGNHRGSVFRLLVGQALNARRGRETNTWGIEDSISKAAQRLSIHRDEIKQSELLIEREVSATIRSMPLLWLLVDDPPSPKSMRGLIERNAIALLSNYVNDPIDSPSGTWLGRASGRDKVRKSGLWNSKHVDDDYDPSFLDELERQIDIFARSLIVIGK